MPKRLKSLGLMLLLIPAACTTPQPPPPRTARPAPPPVHVTPPAVTPPGLANVMGQTARRLESLFGRPALDITEGYARKLQFANSACVLDAYLYPPAAGRDAVVTHVDARLPDGRDYDAGACVSALTPQTQAP